MISELLWKAELVKSALRAQAVAYRCNICGYHGYFKPMGGRRQARCWNCNSFERHRLFALWAEQGFAGKRILHFAPERVIADLVRPGADYVSVDIQPGIADKVLNIEALDEPDDSYDVIICFHVLEHVDDARALAELRRVLAPGGRLLLMFPIVEGWAQTYENPDVADDRGRLIHFGQADHVRFYGADVRDRIRAAGFELEEFTAVEPYVHRHSLSRGQKLFIAS